MTDHRNPFEGVTDFFTEVSRMRALGVHGRDSGTELAERTHASAWVPATDILAAGPDLVIRVELPGVDPDEVDVRLSNGVLTVAGTRGAGDHAGEAAFYLRERFHGEFRRAITLPEGVEADQIAAEVDDGLLTVTVRGAAGSGEGTRISLRDRSAGATPRPVTQGRASPR